MEITGKIIVVLPPQSGVSQAGNNWKNKNTCSKQKRHTLKKCISTSSESAPTNTTGLKSATASA